jgi:hypothetical protein
MGVNLMAVAKEERKPSWYYLPWVRDVRDSNDESVIYEVDGTTWKRETVPKSTKSKGSRRLHAEHADGGRGVCCACYCNL